MSRFFVSILKRYFQRSGRDLPWRAKTITPYEVWVSEVMLQQTQVSRVIEYYKKFLKKFPTVRALSRASWEEFFPYYSGLGYYARARNMLTTARIIAKKYGGTFPRDKKLLMELPGIGEYTASAILSFGYNLDFFSFDTNAQRLLGRFFFGDKKALGAREASKKLLGNKKTLNAAIMDFSSVICTKKPHCGMCPLSSRCSYYKNRGKDEATRADVSLSFPNREAQVFIWLHKNHKEYYSSNPDVFEVFRLPPKDNSRERIKNYFQKEFGLEVSVRPPHKKVYIQGIPTLFVNAQILLGEHAFGIFDREEAHSLFTK